MNNKTLIKLEFDKIISMLENEASSFRGKQLCRRLKPVTDLTKIDLLQEQTAAAFTRIIKKGRISFGDAAPVEESLKRLEIGGALNTAELLRICRLLSNTARAKSYGRHDTQEDLADCLDIYFDGLEPLTPLSNEIERCIISEDEISDDASSALKHIRRSINNLNDRVHTTLSGLVNGSLRTYLQDALITMRGDRYCIPVKAEYRSQVQGLIHDQSASGSTLFIEPMAIVKLNNDLKELYVQEQDEIRKILASLSEEAAQYIEEIRTDYRSLTDLDFIFARGALALTMRASRPILNEEGRIRIREGRHPLLDQKKVVPITVSLGDEFSLLIITGPNTGGKTVSLKTVGLLTLMGQAGLHIPAGDRSEIAVFRQVYADIGDEQSIEQSLSTFSSHMTNIVSFLKKVDDRSLVLFDELGAGTDPTEGAALAIAILSHLHKRNIRTMATTHYSELKIYALSTPGVENACCEFDVESLRPTYRLLIGIPGKSNAFAISGKLGLPGYIIDDAKKRLRERKTIVLAKVIVSAVNLLVFALFSGVCNYFTIVLPLGGLDQPGAVLSTTMGMFFTQLLFFALGLLFASLFKSYKAAVRAGTVFVLAAYVLAFTAEYTGNRFLDYLTPLRYYDVYEVALNGVYLSYIVLTVLIVGACVMVSTRRWKLREL